MIKNSSYRQKVFDILFDDAMLLWFAVWQAMIDIPHFVWPEIRVLRDPDWEQWYVVYWPQELTSTSHLVSWDWLS